MIIFSLFNNVTLIVSLSVLYSLIIRRWDANSTKRHLISGLLFGSVTIIAMMNSVKLLPGIVFDGRSIIISMAGFISGPLSAAITVFMSASYRFWLGGAGKYTGIAVILSSAFIGVAYHNIHLRNPEKIRLLHLWIFGLIVHAAMLLLMLTLPKGSSLETIKQIFLPVLIVYPLGSLLISVVLLDQESRSAAEKALRESREQYRMLTENIKDVVWILDTESMYFRYVSPSVERLRGYKPVEIMAQPVDDALIPSVREQVREIMRSRVEAFLTGKESPDKFYINEIEQPCKDGSTVWTEVITNFYRNPENGKVEVRGVTRDISERKQAELALKASESQYRELVENLNEIIYQTDLNGKLTYISPAVESLFEYTPNELTGKFFSDFFCEKDVPEITKGFRRVIAGHAVAHEYRAWSKSGSLRWIRTSSRPIYENQQVIGLQGIATDLTELKLAEEELQQALEFSELIFKTLDGFIIVLDKDWQIVRFNSACERITGWNAEELLSRNFLYILIPEEQREGVLAVFNQLASDLLPHQHENEWITRDGNRRWISWAYSAVAGPDHEIKYILGTGIDITDRKKAETALKQNHELLDKLCSQVPGMLYQFRRSPDGNYSLPFTSNRVKEIYGASVDEVRYDASAIFRYIHPDDVEKVVNSIEISARNGTDWHSEYRIQQPGFPVRWVWAQSVPERLADGSILWAGFSTDITDRKEKEEILRFTQFSVDHSAEADFWLDLNARFIYLNDAACRSLGCTRAELLSMTLLDINPDISEILWLEYWVKAKEHGAFTITSNHKKKDGNLFPVEISINYLNFDGKEYICMLVRDISERKKLEEQLLQSQKMEAIGRLAGGIAHDFNNLLMVILGYSEMILAMADPETPFYSEIDDIYKAGERASGLTRQLLAFSRKQILQPKVLDLNQLIMHYEKMLRQLIGEDINLQTDLAPELWPIVADPGQIEQIILNLALNARDAMPYGGNLTIETTNKIVQDEFIKDTKILFSGPFVMLSVSDDGCGMDEETKSKIFEPFFTTKIKGKGTGLGLSMVYGIVKQSDGFISVYSEMGHGTVFKIFFPQSTVGQEENAITEKKERSLGNETVLLVEDNDLVRKMAAKCLRGNGYTILESSNGKEAVTLSGDYKGVIDIVVTDVVMPEMGGKQLSEILSQTRPETKVLFMSGYTQNAIVHHGVLEKGLHFIQKPCSPGALLHKIREVLDLA